MRFVFFFYRYLDKEPIALRYQSPCTHSNERYQFSTLAIGNIVRNRKLLYSKKGKVAQDLVGFISSVSANIVSSTKRRQLALSFFLLSSGKKVVPVCKSCFLAALSLTTRRPTTLSKVIFKGKNPTDNRGGDRKSFKFEDKKESLRRLISSLPAKESQ